jgi:hypothetical protein
MILAIIVAIVAILIAMRYAILSARPWRGKIDSAYQKKLVQKLKKQVKSAMRGEK